MQSQSPPPPPSPPDEPLSLAELVSLAAGALSLAGLSVDISYESATSDKEQVESYHQYKQSQCHRQLTYARDQMESRNVHPPSHQTQSPQKYLRDDRTW